MKDKKDESRIDKNDALRKSVWRNSKKIVDDIMPDDSWEHYASNLDKESIPSADMYKNVRQAVDQDIIRQFDQKSKRYNIYRFIKYSAVACLILFISWKWWQSEFSVPTQMEIVDVTLPSVMIQDRWIEEHNTSEQYKWVKLPDGSKVKLYAKSSIRYTANFQPTHRDIYLQGKGYFKVTRDVNRPFSVFSDGTKTTALGTSFTVDAYRNKSNTAVTLHTGKIVVSSTASSPTFDNVYLSQQGEQIVFDQQMRLALHTTPGNQQKDAVTKPMPVLANTMQMTIDKMPLPDVITALHSMYKVEIIIEDKSIEHITYTGTVDAQKETVEDVLQVICLINNLQWRKNDDGIYYITKNEYSDKKEND